MRRWTLLLAGAALWLFLAAIPALADGGPHVAAANSGVSDASRPTAAPDVTGPTPPRAPCSSMLRRDDALPDVPRHARAPGPPRRRGRASSTPVPTTTSPHGADRSAPSAAAASSRPGSGHPRNRSNRVGVARDEQARDPEDVTRTCATLLRPRVPGRHGRRPASPLRAPGACGRNGQRHPTAPPLASSGTAWGNGAAGQRRRRPHPSPWNARPATTRTGTATTASSTRRARHRHRRHRDPGDRRGQVPKSATDLATVTGARNYTVIQGASLATTRRGARTTTGGATSRTAPSRRSGLASGTDRPVSPVTPATVAGPGGLHRQPGAEHTPTPSPDDGSVCTSTARSATRAGYFAGDVPEFRRSDHNARRRRRRRGTSAGRRSARGARPSHTRYQTPSPSRPRAGRRTATRSSGRTSSSTGTRPSSSLECTKCHVAHGSNAQMPGNAALGTDFSNTFDYPVAAGGTAVSNDSSRLLKVDNRGTCQQCHDPTGTVAYPTTPFSTP